MGISPFATAGAATAARVARALPQGKSRDEVSEPSNVTVKPKHKKAPDDAGAFELLRFS
jgi:hypothetical protein